MKKSIVLIISLVIIVSILLFILVLNKPKYSVVVSKVDNQSPDRILTVYNNKNEEIEFKRIELLDGKFLCNNLNATVHYGSIKDVKKLKVILKDKSEVVAKVVEEEEKK